MITAETLKCTVPSPNAVKDAVIYCVTGATNAAEIWSTVGTIIGAVATAIAVIVALYQSRKATKIALDTEKRTREREIEQMQLVGALPAFQRRILEVTARWRDTTFELQREINNLTADTSYYLVFFQGEPKEMADEIRRFVHNLQTIISFMGKAVRNESYDAFDTDEATAQARMTIVLEQDYFGGAITRTLGRFIGQLMLWHVEPKKRQECYLSIRQVSELVEKHFDFIFSLPKHDIWEK